jgi:hypothetical protein
MVTAKHVAGREIGLDRISGQFSRLWGNGHLGQQNPEPLLVNGEILSFFG